MLGYVCKYTPVELLRAMGADPVRITSPAADFNQAEARMHPNVCSYVKLVLEAMEDGDYEGVVLTSCCDSVRRLYDTLQDLYPDKFIYILDLPRRVSEASEKMYARRIMELAKAYSIFSGRKYDPAALAEQLGCLKGSPRRPSGHRNPVRVGILGARCPESVYRLLDDNGAEVVFDLTCTGMDRGLALGELLPPHISAEQPEVMALQYAHALLGQIPCLRMEDVSRREAYIQEQMKAVDGLVYHTVKFCDIYSYEYSVMHRQTSLPVLKIETDLTLQCEGQIKTRIDAFIEALKAAKGLDAPVKERKKMGKGYAVGIDSGSTSTNAVIMNKNREIVAYEIVRTGARAADSAGRALEAVLKKAGLTREDIDGVFSTGYGRAAVGSSSREVTEISCHAKGARYFNPKVCTILDIGGQDSKAIRLTKDGGIADFVMNDKCAAGTGRFLEAMARTLEVSVDELGDISAKSQKDVEISSMCTVFAESEVISLIAQNTEKADIARGVHRAIAGKAVSLMKRVRPEPAYMMTGGVARNKGVVREIEKLLGEPVYICEEPDIVGAAGAALYALDELE
ncbi:MAG: acyl-CoA dehydratase activase [Lachnospiraceae bacterium]|jgi:predicted CoA-substrate-specific enzyme activase